GEGHLARRPDDIDLNAGILRGKRLCGPFRRLSAELRHVPGELSFRFGSFVQRCLVMCHRRRRSSGTDNGQQSSGGNDSDPRCLSKHCFLPWSEWRKIATHRCSAPRGAESTSTAEVAEILPPEKVERQDQEKGERRQRQHHPRTL